MWDFLFITEIVIFSLIHPSCYSPSNILWVILSLSNSQKMQYWFFPLSIASILRNPSNTSVWHPVLSLFWLDVIISILSHQPHTLHHVWKAHAPSSVILHMLVSFSPTLTCWSSIYPLQPGSSIISWMKYPMISSSLCPYSSSYSSAIAGTRWPLLLPSEHFRSLIYFLPYFLRA